MSAGKVTTIPGLGPHRGDGRPDYFSPEYLAELAARGIKPKRRGVAALADRFARALDDLNKAEEKLARSLRKWEKARAKVRRLERELARVQAELDAEARS